MFPGRRVTKAVISFCYHRDALSAHSLMETRSHKPDQDPVLLRSRAEQGASHSPDGPGGCGQLRAGLRGRCHICHCEQFHQAISESPLTSDSGTRSPTKCFWMAANSLAMHWCFLKSLQLPGVVLPSFTGHRDAGDPRRGWSAAALPWDGGTSART